MAGQGRYMSSDEVRKIIFLLSSTEMTVSEIAERMSCSKGAIATVNRKFKVRTYNGLRSRWSNAQIPVNEDSLSTQGLAKKKSA